MIDRYVYRCRRDQSGHVLALVCHSAEWSPRAVAGVLDDLDSMRYRYLIPWEGGSSEILPVQDAEESPGRRSIDAAGPDGRLGGLANLPAV